MMKISRHDLVGVFVFLGLALPLGQQALAQRESRALAVGVQSTAPPFGYVDDNGEVAGFDVDLSRALCARLNQTCELAETEFADVLPMIESGQLDFAAAFVSITDKRRERVAFSEPYFQSPARLVALRSVGADVSAYALDDLDVGVKRQTTSDDYLSDTAPASTRVHRYKTQDEALADLVLRRLDAVLGESVVLWEGFLSQPVGAPYTFVGPTLRDVRWFGEGIGVAVRPDDAELLRRIDEALRAMRSDGELRQLQQRHLRAVLLETADAEGPSQ